MALVSDLLTLHAGLNDMLETEHASAPQFPKHATGRQVKPKKKVHKHARPAFARRVSGTKRAFGIPDMFRPVETLTEHAMFVDLLPAFTKGSRVEWYAMAREWNLRVLHAHKIKSPLDASLKHEHKLKDFAKAFVKATRRKQALMTFAFPQAMQPLDQNMQQEGDRAAAAGATQHVAAGQPAHHYSAAAGNAQQFAAVQPAHRYSATAGNAQQFAAVQPGCQYAAGAGNAQDLAAVQQSSAKAFRHIEHPLHNPAPKRICRAGAGRGQPSRRGGPGTGKSCAPCSHEASVHGRGRVPMKDGHAKFCKWCAPCFKTDKLLVLRDAHVCPNIKLKK